MRNRPALRVSVTAAIALSGAVIAQAGQSPTIAAKPAARSAADRECLARAMYFESNRSAEDGMLAVGTVVANRVKSGRYGPSVCGVVAQPRQFAAGVMSRRMEGEAAERARRVAEAVLAGKRHPSARDAMFFHTAGLKFRYPNMHYVLVSGGNAFYEKRSADSPSAARANAVSMARAYAAAKTDQAKAGPVLAAAGGGAFALPGIRNAASVTPAVRTSIPTPTAAPPAPPVYEQRVATVTPVVAPAPQAAKVPTPPVRPQAAPGDGFTLASAYANPAPKNPGGALAAVAALEPKAKARVISMAPPVQAAMVPTPPSRLEQIAAMPSKVANYVVAQAWAAFD